MNIQHIVKESLNAIEQSGLHWDGKVLCSDTNSDEAIYLDVFCQISTSPYVELLYIRENSDSTIDFEVKFSDSEFESCKSIKKDNLKDLISILKSHSQKQTIAQKLAADEITIDDVLKANQTI